MINVGMTEIFQNMESEILIKAKSMEKITSIQDLDKPIAMYVEPSEMRINNADYADDLSDNQLMENFSDEENNDLLMEEIDNMERVSGCPIDGHGGTWDGLRGNSKWYPAHDEIPKNPKTNPDGLVWGEIFDKYGIDGIVFEDGEPDFSVASKGTVEIDNFSENRYGKGGNFDQACEKLAGQRGCTKEEVKAWMRENKYTWHERSDCKTMDKVPTEVHGNIRHEGGISEVKSLQNSVNENQEVKK